MRDSSGGGGRRPPRLLRPDGLLVETAVNATAGRGGGGLASVPFVGVSAPAAVDGC